MRVVTTLFLIGLLFFAAHASAQHGVISEMSAVEGELCEHNVPAPVCVRCDPSRGAAFEAAGDWCRPHRVPESQCFRCHPDLNFDPLPPMPENADVVAMTDAEALAGLEAFVVPGKVTIFDFDAPWCAPCRNLQAHLRTLLAAESRIAVRRITLPAWEGPVFERYLSEVAGLPYVIVYGLDGARIGTLERFDHAALDAMIAAALAAAP